MNHKQLSSLAWHQSLIGIKQSWHATTKPMLSGVEGAGGAHEVAAVAVCGGVQECNLAARVGWEAWADSPAIGHGPEEKRVPVPRT